MKFSLTKQVTTTKDQYGNIITIEEENNFEDLPMIGRIILGSLVAILIPVAVAWEIIKVATVSSVGLAAMIYVAENLQTLQQFLPFI